MAAHVTERIGVFSRDTDLTGLWSGEYWYGGAPAPTPFTAHIIDTSGDLTGTTLEPNRFADPSAGELSAQINGVRGDLSVRFTKVYDPGPGVHDLPIFYEGSVDPQFTLIDGTWTFGRDRYPSGRFVLVRVSRGQAAEAMVAAESLSLGSWRSP